MFDLIRSVLTLGSAATPAVGTPDRLHVAAAVILLEAAYADYACAEEELDHIMVTIEKTFSLPTSYVRELLDIAHGERERAVELWGFAREVNETFSREEKLRMLEALWRVVLADGHLDALEDGFTRKITSLLRLSHRDMIDAKLAVKRELGIG
jgi:uncharacterized tellurite resistance protein B-like protein